MAEQLEELEVLRAIYEGDSNFREISPTVFQYKYGEDSDPKAFLLEISWPEDYPSQKPTVNMDTFFNKHILPNVKTVIVEKLLEEAEHLLGSAMTFTLFEWVKEKIEELTADQPAEWVKQLSDSVEKITISEQSDAAKQVVKKDNMTKSQKRKMWDRLDAKGERPRGWDWVDIVKHLSQTGPTSSGKSSSPEASAAAQ